MRVGNQFFDMITKVYDLHEKVTNYCYMVNNFKHKFSVNKIVNRNGSELYPYTLSLIFHCLPKQPVLTATCLAITCHDGGY